MWFGNSINQRRAQRRALLHATLVQIRPKKTQPALTALRSSEEFADHMQMKRLSGHNQVSHSCTTYWYCQPSNDSKQALFKKYQPMYKARIKNIKNSSVHNSTLHIFNVERYVGWGCILNCLMLSSLPCFYAFYWYAIPTSCYIFYSCNTLPSVFMTNNTPMALKSIVKVPNQKVTRQPKSPPPPLPPLPPFKTSRKLLCQHLFYIL